MAMAMMQCVKCGTTNQVPAGTAQAACGQCGAVNDVHPQGMVVGAVAQPIVGGAAAAGMYHLPQGFQVPAGVPPGLELLTLLDGFMVKQEVEWAEAITQAIGIDYESNNKYSVYDKNGQKVYFIAEQTGFCWRCCCQSMRPAKLHVYDNVGRQLFMSKRKFVCCPCAWWPCLEDVTVTLGETDQVLGHVKQPCCCGGGCFSPILDITDGQEEPQSTGITVKGPCCFIGDCCGATFNVMEGEKEIGSIQKMQPSGGEHAMQELLTDADRFVMNYPPGLKAEQKATLLAALLLVDFQFFESGGAASASPGEGLSCRLGIMYCFGCPCDCTCSTGNGSDNNGAPLAEGMSR